MKHTGWEKIEHNKGKQKQFEQREVMRKIYEKYSIIHKGKAVKCTNIDSGCTKYKLINTVGEKNNLIPC